MASLFSLSIPQLSEWSRRQAPDHRQLNQPVEAINRMMTGVGVPRQMLGTVQAVSTGTIAATFRLKQNGIWRGDYLQCRTWNTETETEGDVDVLIAKPPSLQRSTRDGKTRAGIQYAYTSNISRRATRTSDSETEVQVIVESYWIGDIIIATTPIKGGTGVIVEEAPLVWMDDNRAGRAWARGFTQ